MNRRDSDGLTLTPTALATGRAGYRCGLLRWLTLMAVVLLGLAGSGTAADEQRRVLVVYSSRQDTQFPIIGDRELPPMFRAGIPEGVDYHAEYLDFARHPEPEYREALRDFLARKYKTQRLDAIIACQDAAFEFVNQNRKDLFPNTPLIFLSNDRDIRRPPNSTGVIFPRDLRPTLRLATALQPDVNQVFVVTGASVRDSVYDRLARAQFASFAPRLTFTYLSGLPMRELEQRVSDLPPRSIVYYLLFYQDGAGENVNPLEYLERLSAIANRPIYSWVDSTMGRGVVGGSLQAQLTSIETLGETTVRVLRGERPDQIPVRTLDRTIDEIDWRQLRRWGIAGARVPAGTRILFRELSVWERYRSYVLGALAVLAAQAALIAGLLLQRRGRRKAEEQTRASQAELRTTYELNRELSRRLLTAQDAERSRIARELHDGVSQEAALLAHDLQLLCVTAGLERDAGILRIAHHEAATRAQGIARIIRALSHRLHPTTLRLVGLAAALNDLTSEFSQPGVEIACSLESVPAVVPYDLSLSLYRVAQEAVRNAVTHGAAHNITVQWRGDRSTLNLKISDDGIGFNVSDARAKGLSLVSMSERIESIGGRLRIQSGLGTIVEAVVPLQAAGAQGPGAR